MDPGLRDRLRTRGGARPPEELKSNRRTVLVVAAGLLVMLGVAGRLSWHVPTVFHINADHHRKGPVAVEADQLYQAYRDDADAAKKRFGGREIVVSGEFLRLVPDGWGSLDMRLKTSNPEAPLGIDVVQLALEDAKELRPGQRVTVSCQHMGSGGDALWVQDCAIQPTGGGSAAPIAPTAPPPPPSPPPPGVGNAG
jgi:hypothetical protein